MLVSVSTSKVIGRMAPVNRCLWSGSCEPSEWSAAEGHDCLEYVWLTWSILALPVLLAHSELISGSAMIMSIIGGLLIYGTIISFTMFFQEEQDF